MFSRPRTIERRGKITVTARHWTPGSQKFAEALGVAVCVLTMGLVGLRVYCFYMFEQHATDVAGVVVFSAIVGFFAMIPGAILTVITTPIFSLLIRSRTTVVISADTVRVSGVSYPRSAGTVHFSNLYPQSVGIGIANSHAVAFGSAAETAGLRMFYGGTAILVAMFKKPELAGRFALACNSAVSRTVPPGVSGFEAVAVVPVYQDGYADAAQTRVLPALNTLPVRRR